MDNTELVANEIRAALNTFTEEGYATGIGFDAQREVFAEEYGSDGELVARYRITFQIEQVPA